MAAERSRRRKSHVEAAAILFERPRRLPPRPQAHAMENLRDAEIDRNDLTKSFLVVVRHGFGDPAEGFVDRNPADRHELRAEDVASAFLDGADVDSVGKRIEPRGHRME